MAIDFYYQPMSSAMRITWALEELGVPYNKHRVHLDKGEQKKPEFLAINPFGKVPALIDDGAKMFESLAILIHLAEKYGTEKGLWPKMGSSDRGLALSWTVWGTVNLFEPTVSRMMHIGSGPRALPPEKRNADIAETAKRTWSEQVAVLDAHLKGREYIVGDSFTLCDLANASVLGFGAMRANMPIGDHPNAAAWMARCQQRPAMARVMAEMTGG